MQWFLPHFTSHRTMNRGAIPACCWIALHPGPKSHELSFSFNQMRLKADVIRFRLVMEVARFSESVGQCGR